MNWTETWCYQVEKKQLLTKGTQCRIGWRKLSSESGLLILLRRGTLAFLSPSMLLVFPAFRQASPPLRRVQLFAEEAWVKLPATPKDLFTLPKTNIFSPWKLYNGWESLWFISFFWGVSAAYFQGFQPVSFREGVTSGEAPEPPSPPPEAFDLVGGSLDGCFQK